MKRRPAQLLQPVPAVPGDAGSPAGEAARRLSGLVAAIGVLDDADSLRCFLLDLCTPAELEALADRWAVVAELAEGRAYREIHERTGVSVTTIGRVSRCLALGAGGYRRAAERLGVVSPGAALVVPPPTPEPSHADA